MTITRLGKDKNFDYTKINNVSNKFREICAEIESILPEELKPFRGGYDEIMLALSYREQFPRLRDLA